MAKSASISFNIPIDKSSRCIFVTVIDGEVHTPYDIVLQKRMCHTDKRNDLERIADVLKKKVRALHTCFSRPKTFLFKKKAKFDPIIGLQLVTIHL